MLLHAQYDHSDPAANARLASGHPPSRVQVWFTEQVDPTFSSLSVYNQDRHLVDLHDSHIAPDNPSSLIISLHPHLPDGAYTIVFHTVSAEDGHAVTSGFSFVVGGGTLPADTGALFGQVQTVDTNFNVWSIVIRWINYLGMAGLVGGLIFLRFVWRPSMAHMQSEIGKRLTKAILRMEARATSFFAWSLLTLSIGWIAFLVYQACVAGASAPWQLIGNSTLLTLLLHSRFGGIWLVRLGLIACASSLCMILRVFSHISRLKSNILLWSMLLVGIAIMYTDALNSHAAANHSAGLLIPIDTLHLAATGFWVGGLFCIVLMLPVALRVLVPGSGDRTRVFAVLIPFFTRVALLSVLVLALTGTIQAVAELGVGDALFQGQYGVVLNAFLASAYGHTLVVKICIFIILIGFGAFNAFRISPQMRVLAADLDKDTGAGSFAAGKLQRMFQGSVRVEVLLALLLLLIVGGLTSLSPPPAPSQGQPSRSAGPFVKQGQAGDLTYQLVINPGKIGPNTFEVNFTDSKGQPLQHAGSVLLYFVMLDMDMGTEVLDLTPVPQHPGHYQAQASVLSMSGNWEIRLIVRRVGFDDVKVTIKTTIQF